MKKAIVTGANGFLGSWLVRKLLDEKVEVIAVIRSKLETITRLQDNANIRIVCCDMADIDSLPNRIKERDIDCFFHLAWNGSTGVERSDYKLQLKNAEYTADAARVAGQLRCRRFIGAGSLAEKDCMEYISTLGSRPNGVTSYGTAKIAAHYLSKAVCATDNIEHIWAYLPNTYGVGNYTKNFVNFAARRMLTGERSEFTSGEQLYEFIHVSDTVAGLFAMADRGKAFHSYYIGGAPQQLKKYIQIIRDCIDPSIHLYLGAIPFNGVEQFQDAFDGSPLRQDTGFNLKVSFTTGIKETVEWLRKVMEEDRQFEA